MVLLLVESEEIACVEKRLLDNMMMMCVLVEVERNLQASMIAVSFV